MLIVEQDLKRRLARWGANKLFGDDVDRRQQMADTELEERFDRVWHSRLRRLVDEAEPCTSDEVPGRLTEKQAKYFDPSQDHKGFRIGGAEFIVQIEQVCDGERLSQLWRVASSDTHPKTLFVNFQTVAERKRFRQLAESIGWNDERLGLELVQNFMKIHDKPTAGK